MLNRLVRPTTIAGIKRLANQIKKAQQIKHHLALDIAGQAAGFDNYKHAQKFADHTGKIARTSPLYITKYWRDEKTYEIGRETHLVQLSKPLLETCKKKELKSIRGLGASRLVAEDHLVSDMLSHSQEFARDQIYKAARAIRFMEHTGLRPLKGHHEKYQNITRGLPNIDHDTDWYDPKSGQLILIDEPYNGVPNLDIRVDWAAKHNWYLRQSNWQGMYYPYSCGMFVATSASTGYDFDALMMKIDAIPAPMVPSVWLGESVGSHETFLSPTAKTPQDQRRAKSKATIYALPSKTTTPYRPYSLDPMGMHPRKPRGEMTLDTHIETGLLIKAILQSSAKPLDVNWKINHVRSTLEDWMCVEFRNEFPKDIDVIAVYYGGRGEKNSYERMASTPEAIIGLLNKLKNTMKKYYPECEPLRRLIEVINTSIKHMEKEIEQNEAA
ncbi:MAG: DUF5623 domain-containing protein [Alphaproteobacteria bacterium]